MHEMQLFAMGINKDNNLKHNSRDIHFSLLFFFLFFILF